MADFLTLSDFTPLVGSTFRLPDLEGVTLRLKEAKALAPMKRGSGPPGPGHREAFDLIFIGPATPILPQQIWRLETEGMHSLEIFIVALGPEDGGLAYQAIFT